MGVSSTGLCGSLDLPHARVCSVTSSHGLSSPRPWVFRALAQVTTIFPTPVGCFFWLSAEGGRSSPRPWGVSFISRGNGNIFPTPRVFLKHGRLTRSIFPTPVGCFRQGNFRDLPHARVLPPAADSLHTHLPHARGVFPLGEPSSNLPHARGCFARLPG